MAAAASLRHLLLVPPPRVASLPSNRFRMAKSRHLDLAASLPSSRSQTAKSKHLAHLARRPHQLAALFVLLPTPAALLARTALLAAISLHLAVTSLRLAVISLRRPETTTSALAARTAPSQHLELLHPTAEPTPTRLPVESVPALNARRNLPATPPSQAPKVPRNTPVVQPPSPSASSHHSAWLRPLLLLLSSSDPLIINIHGNSVMV